MSTSGLQGENKAPEPERARCQIASLEKQDANLRHALRTARPNAAERIALEIDQVAAEVRQAVAKRDELQPVRTPISPSKKLIQQTMDDMNGADRERGTRHAGRMGCATFSTGSRWTAARSMPSPSGSWQLAAGSWQPTMH